MGRTHSVLSQGALELQHDPVPMVLADSAVPAGLRRLRQEVDAEDAVTSVTTAAELQEAVLAGVPHIRILEHLDMIVSPSFRPAGGDDGTYRNPAQAVLGSLASTTKSIRGSCKGPPPPAFLAKLSPAAELLPLQEGQCLILLQRSFAFQDGDVWFDNLLLRFQRVERNYHSYTGISTRQHNANSNLFMTRMAFQGDGQQAEDLGNTQAIGLNRKTSMYAEGCTFANLGGNATLHGSPAAILDANANFVRCRFQDSIIGGSGAKFHGVITAQWEASVRLENSTFFGTIGIGVHLLDRSQEASFYTDSIGMWVVVQQVGNERPSPLTAAPKDFLTAEDDWFMNTQMEVEGGVLVEAPSEDTRLPPGQPRPDLPSGFLPASPPVYPGVSPPASSGDTLSEASVIVFIISAALVSLFIALGLIAACVFIYWFKQRNARDERPGQATEMQPTGTMHVHNASYQPKATLAGTVTNDNSAASITAGLSLPPASFPAPESPKKLPFYYPEQRTTVPRATLPPPHPPDLCPLPRDTAPDASGSASVDLPPAVGDDAADAHMHGEDAHMHGEDAHMHGEDAHMHGEDGTSAGTGPASPSTTAPGIMGTLTSLDVVSDRAHDGAEKGRVSSDESAG